MENFRSEYEEILKKVRHIKGICPNFYISGTSIPAIENLGMQIAHTVEEGNLIQFKGIVKNFTIKMPYYSDLQGAISFLEHLRESVSIAKDCYDSYRGLVLIELSREWSKKGYHSTMKLFLDYLQENEQICFLILVPEKKNRNEEKNLFFEFSRCGLWMKIDAKTPSVHQCMAEFRNTASHCGYRISDDAKQLLMEKLKARDESDVENIRIVQQLVKQIMFNRSIEKDDDKVIHAYDIEGIPVSEKKMQTKIGFAMSTC